VGAATIMTAGSMSATRVPPDRPAMIAEMADNDTSRISDHLVRLVQVVFAMVLAQSLFLFRGVVVHPLRPDNRVAALALVAVFTTTVLSWIDWHTTMVFSPYETRHRAEKARLFADLLIVVTYAYLLFTVEPLVGHPSSSLRRHLLGYPLVFAGYFASGITRRRTYGVAASRLQPIGIFLAIYAAIWYFYSQALNTATGRFTTINLVTLALVLGVMIGYRLYRAWYRDDERARKSAGLVIGIDVDGVLADQIRDVLPRIKARHGVALTRADIIDWRLPIASTDIAQEIELAQQDRRYVLRMRSHDGARRLLRFLYKHNRVLVVTARSDASRDWTREWLNKNWLRYDDLETSGEAKKSAHGITVLIDDYLGNILEFLQNTNGVAVLVDQPWNQQRDALQPFMRSGRVVVVRTLREVESRWSEIVDAVRPDPSAAAA
jgi:uncharacterized HAD superfamily protein